MASTCRAWSWYCEKGMRSKAMENALRGIRKHWTACIDATAKLGDNCTVWNDVQIREGAELGKGCIIGKGTYIDANVRIGDYCKIQNYACIYSGVELESNVFIGPSVTFTNDLYPRAFSKEWVTVKTLVREGASIGANATIKCGVVLGEYSMIGAGSVVTDDVQPFALVVGNPAKIIDYVNLDGSRKYIDMLTEACSRGCNRAKEGDDLGA